MFLGENGGFGRPKIRRGFSAARFRSRKMLEIDPERVELRVSETLENALLMSLSGDFVEFLQKSSDIVPDRTNGITFRHTSDPYMCLRIYWCLIASVLRVCGPIRWIVMLS